MPTPKPDTIVRRGVFTYYPDKTRTPVTINLTPAAHVKMQKIRKATGVSRGDILEHGFRKLVGIPINQDLETVMTRAVLARER